jgi:hypothetical protein
MDNINKICFTLDGITILTHFDPKTLVSAPPNHGITMNEKTNLQRAIQKGWGTPPCTSVPNIGPIQGGLVCFRPW